jgi:hypothetical protein
MEPLMVVVVMLEMRRGNAVVTDAWTECPMMRRDVMLVVERSRRKMNEMVLLLVVVVNWRTIII